MFIPTKNTRGLYLITMAAENKPGTHYAILDDGNVLGRSGVRGPTIYHLRPEGLMWTTDLTHVISAQRIDDEVGAVVRFTDALKRPTYGLLTNNCEHFARYVASGDHSSGQAVLIGVAGIAAAVGLAFVLSKD